MGAEAHEGLPGCHRSRSASAGRRTGHSSGCWEFRASIKGSTTLPYQELGTAAVLAAEQKIAKV